MSTVALLILMYAVYPLWVAAGLADWACHRRTRIETTAGLAENLFHWVLYAQGGMAVLAVVLLEPTGALLLIVLAVFVLHELTVYVELRYAVPRREVAPLEQMVHSFQELMLLVGLGLLAVLAGGRLTDLSLQWRTQPWPPGYLPAAFAATLLFNAGPLAEEGWRCLKARTRARPAPR